MNQNNILKLIFVKKMYEHEKLPWYNFRCSHNHICNIILILKYQMYIHIDRQIHRRKSWKGIHQWWLEAKLHKSLGKYKLKPQYNNTVSIKMAELKKKKHTKVLVKL